MGTNIEELLAFGLDERTWIRNLPHSLADLVRLIGLEPTLRLALHYGGGTAVIPKGSSLASGRPLEGVLSIVGEDAAAILCERFGPMNMLIPACLHGRLTRRLRWLSLIKNGLSEREAAQRIGISRTTHYEWKRLYLEPAT